MLLGSRRLPRRWQALQGPSNHSLNVKEAAIFSRTSMGKLSKLAPVCVQHFSARHAGFASSILHQKCHKTPHRCT